MNQNGYYISSQFFPLAPAHPQYTQKRTFNSLPLQLLFLQSTFSFHWELANFQSLHVPPLSAQGSHTHMALQLTSTQSSHPLRNACAPPLSTRLTHPHSLGVSTHPEFAVVQALGPAVQRGDEWDVMVAHGLGIDHAGHTYNVGSPQMRAKVQETDRHIKEVTTHG